MSDFFKGVRKHIGKLDAVHLREQFGRVADELDRLETLIRTLKEGLVRQLIASNFNEIIEIYDFYSGKQIYEIHIKNSLGLFGICLWDENNLLVACCDNTIKIINLKDRKLKKSLYGHNNYVTTIKKIYIPKLGDCLISQGITTDSIKLWTLKK